MIDIFLQQKVIVTCTTIHTRIDTVSKVIDSILKQEYRNLEVHLYISKEAYLLDEGIKEIPKNLALIEDHRFDIYYVDNTGPYRKLLPCLEKNFANKEQIIITIDDDVVYPSNFITTLMVANHLYDCPIAYRGRDITFDSGKINSYSLWNKNDLSGKSFSKLPTGKDGILYKPKYFHENVLNVNDAVNICQTADDLWFKWHTVNNGYESVLLFDSLSQSFRSLNPADKITLFDMYNKNDQNNSSLNKNDKYVGALQTYFAEKFNQNFLTHI